MTDLYLALLAVVILVAIFVFSMKTIKQDTRSICEKKGHNYEARYSKGPSLFTNSEYTKASEYHFEKMAESYRPITYECDICTRCGDIINKKNKAED